jgi:transcription initiation factor TFIID TATA-box-binding protein
MTIDIANAVGSGDLNTELALDAVETELSTPYVEYDPTNYHGLYLRLEEKGPIITVYWSGKYIVSGCSSFEELHRTNDGLIDEFSELGITEDGQNTGFSVQNVVCTGDVEADVELSSLSISLGLESTEYEPEQFAGLIYRPSDFDAVLLIFATGKVVITGSKDLETAESAFRHLQSKVQELT